ncbi:mitochondrial proton-transporting ATP synthase complex assembly [Coemansia sp. RSA 1813]|nr:mitochondrial proton-transporting ATP synthase complex assembly [Coemansia sp. RSA 1646]KAJ1771955.1 mitochondrial proton-transporting ATP synthase complex assembly [Coemansia sp. RSA 1843]KAJ2089726.1 mitochondrial proton-transporting ATP synthase complex assembly [Coemansia sp. RSA 986]KAJ2214270.1 mitochondrial proton-transporting ATP synthase complex assembly [Coemansia sp. RSA 487]KAJ2569687.1 mitochondrial proton-transporting ATP synthase complex assembly [Coemansia sp. RSA 1813]
MVPVYEGSISKAARFMKLASVTSLIGASAAVPFYFTGDSEVPSAARMVLALTTVGMTGSSTLLAAWALKPYITTLHVVANEDDTSDSSIEVDADTPLLVETLTFLAKPYTRLVFPEQLASASVPMASWVVRQPSEALVAKADGILAQINKNRKKGDQIRLAQKGDKLYAFTQGQISALMAKIIAVSPAQEQ